VSAESLLLGATTFGLYVVTAHIHDVQLQLTKQR